MASAGRYRRREANIGVVFEQISSEIRKLVDDTRVRVEYAAYEQDETAVRFLHRLVSIHAFPDGSGRHARIAADYLIASLGAEPFSWGARLNTGTEELRIAYLRADDGDVKALIDFVRSEHFPAQHVRERRAARCFQAVPMI